MLEALIGAIYIDCETDLQIVWDVYTRLFPLEEINKVIDIKPKHPVAELMENSRLMSSSILPASQKMEWFQLLFKLQLHRMKP